MDLFYKLEQYRLILHFNYRMNIYKIACVSNHLSVHCFAAYAISTKYVNRISMSDIINKKCSEFTKYFRGHQKTLFHLKYSSRQYA